MLKKKWSKILLVILSFMIGILILGGFFLKAAIHTPSAAAQTAAATGTEIPGALKFAGDPKKPAVLFYQGALVAKESYSLWAEKVATAGFSVYLIQEPFALAVLAPNKAQQILDSEKLTSYVIGGHSLGGVMASRFAAKQSADSGLTGVFFLASYPDQKGSLKAFKGSVLSVTASYDGVLNQKQYQEAKNYMPSQVTYQTIAGGNHAGFGSYGSQKGDHPAKIKNAKQQEQVARILINWLNQTEDKRGTSDD
ncbi:alpha/beta hydrolase [Enterococcus faecalis]